MKRLPDKNGVLQFVIGGPDDPDWVRIGHELRIILRQHFGGPRDPYDLIALSAHLLDQAIQLQLRVMRSQKWDASEGPREKRENHALEELVSLARQLWAVNSAMSSATERKPS